MDVARKPSKSTEKWVYAPQSELGELPFRQCKGASSKRVCRHDVVFLGVADIAGLLWCEIQATISQWATQDGYISAAWQDDHKKGETISRGRRKASSASSQDAPLPKDRFAAGRAAQERHALYHRSVRRHWNFGRYFVIGIPDAVEKEFVYEFKYSKHARSNYTFENAMAQANLYGALFVRTKLKIHLVGPNAYERVVDGDVRRNDAEALIERAWRLMCGSEEFHRPEPWKCSPCRYRHVCTVPSQNRVPGGQEIQEIAQLTLGGTDGP